MEVLNRRVHNKGGTSIDFIVPGLLKYPKSKNTSKNKINKTMLESSNMFSDRFYATGSKFNDNPDSDIESQYSKMHQRVSILFILSITKSIFWFQVSSRDQANSSMNFYNPAIESSSKRPQSMRRANQQREITDLKSSMNFDLSEVKDKTSSDIQAWYNNYKHTFKIAPGLMDFRGKPNSTLSVANFTIVDKGTRRKQVQHKMEDM